MTQRTSQQLRALTFHPEAERAANGTIPVIVSTDALVDVDDGPEILVHDAAAIDLQRAPLPIVATHALGQVNVGVVENLRVDRSGSMAVLRGDARFGKRQEAAGYEADVLGGVIRSVSVRYARVKARVRADGVLVTSRWTPSHVAMIAEPADAGAGFYRQAGATAAPAFEIEADESAPITVSQPAAHQRAAPVGVSAMDDTQAVAGNSATQSATVIVTEDHTNRPSVAALEKSRQQAIRNLAKTSQCDDRYVDRWIRDGASLERVADDMLEIMKQRGDNQAATYLDMPKREVGEYSLMRALRAAASKDWSKAGLELEANRELTKRLHRLPKADTAFFVPLDIMMRGRSDRQQRDMTSAGVSGSNYLVSTNNQPGNFIELLRNTSVGLRMGVTPLRGLQGNVTIPKMTAGNTGYWLTDENTAITESQPTIGQLSLVPKNVAALTELSHQLMQQSSPDAEQLVMDSIARDIGLAVDVGILRGSGASGQPTGIATTGSIGAFTGTSLAAAGLLDAQADVAAANALNPGCGYVTTPAVAALLMARPELPSTGTTRMWKGNMREGSIFDMPALSSAQMSSATMLFGWWPSVVLAEWGVLELMTNPFSDFTRGLTAVRGWYTCDVGVRYAGAWSYATTIT
jgi:HK97 family phage major capsid protein